MAKMLLPLLLLPDDSTDGVLMRPNSTALDTAKARRAHPLFLHCQDHPRQHIRDRFLPDRSSFALFSPGILVVHSLSTHPTSVTNIFHRFNLCYRASLPYGPRFCGSFATRDTGFSFPLPNRFPAITNPRPCSPRSRSPPAVLSLMAASSLACPGRSCQLEVSRVRRDLRGRLLH